MINTKSSFYCDKLYENGMDKKWAGYCFMGYQETITFILEMIGTIAFCSVRCTGGIGAEDGYFRSFRFLG